jgi:hypothetical protein
MALSRTIPAFLSVSVLLAATASARAQILEMREKNGKQIMCALSGLRGFGSYCGLDNDFYPYIMLATIVSVETISDNEFHLRLHPDEIFRGDPATEIDAVTNQGQCLPDLHPGDQWLAFLRRDKERGLVLAYENDSRILKGFEDELARLRHLARMTSAGLLSGNVYDVHPGESERWTPVANYQIVATDQSTLREHRVFTDKEGHFEFEPLPAGDYMVNSNTASGIYTADYGSVKIDPHGCMKLNIDLQPDGILSGRVLSPDGKPLTSQRVYIFSADHEDSGWSSESIDDDGAFTLRGVQPGRYLLGLGEVDGHGEPKIAVYFPGTLASSKAAVITLGYAEHRENLDIVIPAAPK